MNEIVPVKQTVADLAEAARRIRTEGWSRGQFFEPVTGRRCAVGALYKAVGVALPRVTGATPHKSLFQRCQMYAAAEAIMPLIGSDRTGGAALAELAHFNDFECPGGEELAELFDQAREKLEAEL